MDTATARGIDRVVPTKSCPVVLRSQGVLEILAFAHPLAGLQLVKGSIEPGESPEAAALRELAEESGIDRARTVRNLGTWHSGYQGQVWSFYLCEVHHRLPERWTHHAADDGGHDFRFFWHPLADPGGEGWHEVFRGALAFIRKALAGSS